MNVWWNLWSEVGEMFGSLILTFGTLVVILVAKQKSFGLDTNLKKRMFMGVMIPLAVILGLIACKGFGGHGQINPAITLIVGAYLNEFQNVLATIGFQLIGATGAALMFLATLKAVDNKEPLKDMFKFNEQGVVKTGSIELFGNMFWLIPIGAMVPAYVQGQIDFFQLALGAAVGKAILVGAFEEFGAANFNSQIWFGKMIVTFVAQRGRISKKALASELSGLAMNMGIGIAMGYIAHQFIGHAGGLAKYPGVH